MKNKKIKKSKKKVEIEDMFERPMYEQSKSCGIEKLDIINKRPIDEFAYAIDIYRLANKINEIIDKLNEIVNK